MKTKALRLYGAEDIRLEEFELPEITQEEVLIRVVSDSVCASTYKAVKQGTTHKRVPPDVDKNPVIVGHELCGEILLIIGYEGSLYLLLLQIYRNVFIFLHKSLFLLSERMLG